MKKQYKLIEVSWCQTRLYIYHDGELVDSKKLWDNEVYEEVERLESDGYVYGYTQEEVEKAKKRYEEMLENIIQ